MLEVKDLVKRYGSKTAVDHIGFSVGEGEVFGLLGPNGAGKSTTINIITGLLRKDSGSVFVGGMDTDSHLNECKKLLGVVPQDLAIYSDLTAMQNVAFFGSLYGLSGRALKARAEETLDFVGLKDRARDKAKTFSGGIKRRLNIACGLVHRPKLLILDEPTVGIDPQSRNHILESIRQLNAQGMAILYTTHYMEEAQQLCSRIAVMDAGKVIALGTLPELRGLMDDRRFMTLAVEGDMPLDALRRIEGIIDAQMQGGAYRIQMAGQGNQLADVLALITSKKLRVTDLSVSEPDLEDVFLTLTGRSLRD